jgi:hypothetical protein
MSTTKSLRAALASALLIGAAAFPMQANAISLSVKLACASDYYAHCSAHPVDSSATRQCMRRVGAGLSKGCIDALVGAGEVSKAEVQRKAASLGR